MTQEWRFLGAPVRLVAGEDRAGSLSRKGIALLSYLSLSEGPVKRDELAHLLWPDSDASHARQSLRQCLVDIRKALGDEFDAIVEVTPEDLTLRPGSVDVDVVKLRRIRNDTHTSPDTFAELCRGPFLDGFSSRSRAFDAWAEARRSELLGTLADALDCAAAKAAERQSAEEQQRLEELRQSLTLRRPPESGGKPSGKNDRNRRSFTWPGRWRSAFAAAGLIAVVAVVAAALAGPFMRWIELWNKQPVRIAVLPFDAVHQTQEEMGIAAGVTLGVTNGLWHITDKDLYVITDFSDSRTMNVSDRVEHAKSLDVRYVISGTVAMDESNVRVTVRRTDAEEEIENWRQTVSRPMTEAFSLYDQVTLEILKSLDIDISPAEKNRIQYLDDTDDLRAWLAISQAVVHLLQVTEEDIVIARQFYAKALEIDPNYRSARRGLAWCALLSVRLGFAPDEEKAIAEARNQLAVVLRTAHEDPRVETDSMATALEGLTLLLEGHQDEAVETGELATRLLPGSADVWAVLAHSYTYSDQPEKALHAIERAMELSPRHPSFYRWIRARTLRLLGDPEQSIEILTAETDRPLVYLVELTAAYAEAERIDEARQTADEIKALKPSFSASDWVRHPSFKNPERQSRDFELLSKAGL